MNVEFISKPELAVVCLEMQGGTEEDQSALQRLSGQVDDELNEFR